MSTLEEIRARAEKATEGPWEVDGMDSGHSKYGMNWWITVGEGDTVCDMDGLTRAGNDDLAKDDGAYDAEFIAHARTDVPKLVNALQRAEAVAVMWEQGVFGADGAAAAKTLRHVIEEALA